MNGRTGTLTGHFERNRFIFFVAFLFLLAMMGTVQDYAEASFHNYSFYISESLLFKTYWLFFIPSAFFILSVKQIKNRVTCILLSVLLSFAHLILFAFTLHIVSGVGFAHTYDLIWAIKKSFAEDFYKFFVIYTFIIFWTHLQKANGAICEVVKKEVFLHIMQGRKNVSVPVAEIHFISADSPYLAIYTRDEKFLYQSSLKDIMTKLDPEVFCRIHRSAIVNIQKVTAFTSRLNGDYDIEMNNGRSVRMSRNFCKAFKSRLS